MANKTKIDLIGPRALSPREREVVRLVCTGLLTKDAARLMGISEKTAATQRTNAMLKLGLDNAVKLTHWAIANGLVKVMTFGEAPRAAKPANTKRRLDG